MSAEEQEYGSVPVGEEAEETDANEALGQHVKEEAPQELVGAEGPRTVCDWHSESCRKTEGVRLTVRHSNSGLGEA